MQSLFIDDCDAHVLFLLDCCFASASIKYLDGTSTLEALCASGFENVAPLSGKDSFTTFLVDILKDCRVKGAPIYAEKLRSKITAKMNRTYWQTEERQTRRVTPHHFNFSNKPACIFLSTLTASEGSDSVVHVRPPVEHLTYPAVLGQAPVDIQDNT